jgi:hypothetical protein
MIDERNRSPKIHHNWAYQLQVLNPTPGLWLTLTSQNNVESAYIDAELWPDGINPLFFIKSLSQPVACNNRKKITWTIVQILGIKLKVALTDKNIDTLKRFRCLWFYETKIV